MPNIVIHKGRLIELHQEQVPLREGGHTHFDIVKHPGGAVVLAINEFDQICLLRQWRHAVDAMVWEAPAGCLEPNEPPLNTAKRELEEEAGITAKQWRNLGTLVPSPGFSNEVLYLFEAKDLCVGTQNLDDAEQLEVHWLPRSKIKKMIKNNQIIDAKTLSIIAKSVL